MRSIEKYKIVFLSADCIEGQESRVFPEDYQSPIAAMRTLGSYSAPGSGVASFNATRSSSDSYHVFLQVHSKSLATWVCLSGQEFLLAIFLSLNGWKITKESNLRDMTPFGHFVVQLGSLLSMELSGVRKKLERVLDWGVSWMGPLAVPWPA